MCLVSSFVSPLRKIVMQRPIAVTNLELIGSCDDRRDISLGVARCGSEIKALRETCGNRRRQGAAGAVRIFGGDAFGRQANDPALPYQQINAFITIAVTTFDQ